MLCSFISSALVDVVVGSGDEQEIYKLHEAIICAKSPYFARCFASGMVEAREKKVVLEDVDPKSFEIMAEWIYTSDVTVDADAHRSPAEVMDTYHLADRLCMEQLKNDSMDCLKAFFEDATVGVAELQAGWNGRRETKLLDFLIREFAYDIRESGWRQQASELHDLPRELAICAIHEVHDEHRRRYSEKENNYKHIGPGPPSSWNDCVFHEHVDTDPCDGGNMEPGIEDRD